MDASSPEDKEEPKSSWFGSFTKSVASATAYVSQSLSMEIINPEEMARIKKEEEKKTNEDESSSTTTTTENKSSSSDFGFNKILSNVSTLTLDTLEGIGKKTINIIHETDPNMKNRIRSIRNNKYESNLSEVLKEAREKTEENSLSSATSNSHHQQHESVSKKKFEDYLDEHKGQMYLEALEILSKQSKLKIESLLAPLAGKALEKTQETLDEIEELCEMPSSDSTEEAFDINSLSESLQKAIEDIGFEHNFDDLAESVKKSFLNIESLENDPGLLSCRATETFAILSSLFLKQFLLLAQSLVAQSRHSTADEADSISQLTTIYFSLLNAFAAKYSQKIADKIHSTNVFLECSSATSLVKKGFQLFLPILQLGAL